MESRVDDGRMVLPHNDVGAGPAVLLLHAGIADRTMWAEHLGPIAAAGYRVVAVDLPGFGEALPSRESAEWSDVVETMDALSIKRTTLVGNSFGGDVALRVAVVAPERIAALVLVSARPPGMEPSSELQAVWEAEESALERGDVEAAVGAIVDAWLRTEAAPALRGQVAAMQRRALEVQLAAGEQSTGLPDPIEANPDALERLAIPTLVAAGELDMPDFRDGVDTLAHHLQHVRRVVIPRAGHLAPLEQPEAFRDVLIGFLRQAATQDVP
jgi:pimeloyl-ACP methyl ester carboxylesterase